MPGTALGRPRTVRARTPLAQLPYWDAPHGRCRLCGKPCPDRWHDNCAETWRLSDPKALRVAVARRDGGRCVDCPDEMPPWPSADWHVDHVVELADGGPSTLANAVTRCRPHHTAKTAVARRLRTFGRCYRAAPARQGHLPLTY